jgi:hypothetical protein
VFLFFSGWLWRVLKGIDQSALAEPAGG